MEARIETRTRTETRTIEVEVPEDVVILEMSTHDAARLRALLGPIPLKLTDEVGQDDNIVWKLFDALPFGLGETLVMKGWSTACAGLYESQGW